MKDLWRLWRLYRPYRIRMALGAVAALATLLANVLLMGVSGWFLTAMALAGAAGVAMNYFTPAALIRAAAILRTGGRYGERLLTHEATLRLLAGLRVWLFRRLLPLAPAGLAGLHSGDLLSRVRADIDALDTLYVRVLVPALVALAGGGLILAFLALYDWRIAALVLGLMLLAGVAVPAWSQARGTGPGRRAAVLEGQLRTAAVDGLQGLAELEVLGAAEDRTRRLGDLSRALAEDRVRLAGYNGIAAGAVGLAANLGLWGLLWLAIPTLAQGRLAPPALVMLALLTLASFEALAPLPLAFQQLGRTRAAARRLFELADTPPPVCEPPGRSPWPQGFDLEIRDLAYRYPGHREPALTGVTLAIPQGTRVAILGPSGSGKSTLLDLLLGLRAPTAGEIRLGGQPLAAYRGEDLRRHLTLVGQHTHLFAASIAENLRIARPDATRGDLEAACRAAQVHDFVAALPEGYDTWVGETGVRLSGGQARRLAIARALLRDTPVLLLDEPTEGLDGETAGALMASLDLHLAGRTLILAAHRPLGLRVDRVLALELGRTAGGG